MGWGCGGFVRCADPVLGDNAMGGDGFCDKGNVDKILTVEDEDDGSFGFWCDNAAYADGLADTLHVGVEIVHFGRTWEESG